MRLDFAPAHAAFINPSRAVAALAVGLAYHGPL
jgi:hypothetical protein